MSQTLDDRVLLVDKPAGITSFAVVRRLRRAAGVDKVGHSGSLDPLATGLLVLCTGAATRVASLFVDLPKIYEARVRFGRATTSYDKDGVTTAEGPVPALDAATVRAATAAFVGEIEQRPPMVSAVKVGGQRLYELARRGEEIDRAPRRVMVYAIDLLALGEGFADLRVHCGRGCYVRSIAHELGLALGVPAHLEALRRVAVGEFTVDRAATLDAFETVLRPATPPAARPAATLAPPEIGAAVLTVPAALAHLPELRLRASFESGIRNGRQPLPGTLQALPRSPGRHRLVSDDGQRLLGLVDVDGHAIRLALVFATPLEVAETGSA